MTISCRRRSVHAFTSRLEKRLQHGVHFLPRFQLQPMARCTDTFHSQIIRNPIVMHASSRELTRNWRRQDREDRLCQFGRQPSLDFVLFIQIPHKSAIPVECGSMVAVHDALVDRPLFFCDIGRQFTLSILLKPGFQGALGANVLIPETGICRVEECEERITLSDLSQSSGLSCRI